MLRCTRIITASILILAAAFQNVNGRSLHQFTTVQPAGGSFSSDGTPNPRNPAIDALLSALLSGFKDEVAADIARGGPASTGRSGESSTPDKQTDEVKKDKTGDMKKNGDAEKPGEAVETTDAVETVEAAEASGTGGAVATVQTSQTVKTVQTVQTVSAQPSDP